MNNRSPDDLLLAIAQTRQELLRGSDALYESELAAERAEDAAQTAFNAVLLTAEGSIPVKEAQAHEATVEERDEAFIARASYNRVRTKIRALESSLVSLQAELKWAREAGA